MELYLTVHQASQALDQEIQRRLNEVGHVLGFFQLLNPRQPHIAKHRQI